MIVLTSVAAFLAAIGATALGLCRATGALTLFALSGASHIFRPPWYPAEFARQFLRIGYFSLPVVGMTALFTGGALALQIYSGCSTLFFTLNPHDIRSPITLALTNHVDTHIERFPWTSTMRRRKRT